KYKKWRGLAAPPAAHTARGHLFFPRIAELAMFRPRNGTRTSFPTQPAARASKQKNSAVMDKMTALIL
ncbi:hypothetical protein, partial [Cloacibacillus evryensis]|uniref:hypothetical protein n=1 Tax=Cloacibacillus evryensis TaxID=508460 RepID=UPI003AB61F97